MQEMEQSEIVQSCHILHPPIRSENCSSEADVWLEATIAELVEWLKVENEQKRVQDTKEMRYNLRSSKRP